MKQVYLVNKHGERRSPFNSDHHYVYPINADKISFNTVVFLNYSIEEVPEKITITKEQFVTAYKRAWATGRSDVWKILCEETKK